MSAVARTLGVLITYYGERDLLRECVESLLVSGEAPDEILVYDDASEWPARDYIPKGASVKVIRGAVNRGPAHGRNVLLRTSRSDYVHFHDADDLFHHDWGRRVRETIEETDADVVFTEVASYVDGVLACERVLGLRRLLSGEDLVAFCLQGAVLVPSGTYRRERVLAIAGYREALWQSEDFDFHVRLAASGVSYRALDEPLVLIRVRREGRSQNRRETWSCYAAAVAMLATQLDGKYRPYLADAARRAGSALLHLDADDEAKIAFAVAEGNGPGLLRDKRWLYRTLAALLGLEGVERLGRSYHRRVPAFARRWLTMRRWS